jgi:hypothetical protein
VFCTVLRTVTISLHRLKYVCFLIFEVQSIYCALRSEPSYIFHVEFSLERDNETAGTYHSRSDIHMQG